jgi:hypothetical protein
MTYSFERKFRLKILALMLDNAWMALYGSSLIEPFYFEQDDEIEIAKAILDYRTAYGRSPVDSDDLTMLAGIEHGQTICTIYDMQEEGNLELAADQVIKFAQEQAAKAAILESVDDINKGDLTSARHRLEEAMKVGENIISPGIDPIADVEKWLYDYWSDKVRTGITHLDEVLDGGLNQGELGVVLAGMNVGKSMALINIGFGAASIGSGKNVVHFTHEMSVAQVAKRYAARMTFRFPQRDDDLNAYEEELIEAARKLMPGRIRIIGGAEKMTIEQIQGHIDRLIAEDFIPGLIIDDYADLIKPSQRYTEHRFELSANYENLRALSFKYCPIWSASQTSRAALNKEIVTLADLAEDIGKAAISDVIVALCQTREELESDQCRLYMAKIRDGSKKVPLIQCKFYGGSQAIVSTGYVDKKVDEADA